MAGRRGQGTVSGAIRWLQVSRWLAALWLAAGTVAADDAPLPGTDGDDHVWDCWVSTDLVREVVSYKIRCIRDRPFTDPALADPTTVDGLLDYVHEMIHAREFAALDRDLASGLGQLLAGHVWSIRIHQYPYDESWDAELPQRLVQAALCESAAACPVMVFR